MEFYFIIINIVSLIIVYIDKKKAQKQLWRIKENHIHLLSLLGGALGTVSGMLIFHHKTRKIKFCIITAIAFLENVIIIKKIIDLTLL